MNKVRDWKSVVLDATGAVAAKRVECDQGCRVPQCFGTYNSEQKQWIVLEDLNNAGFEVRR